MTDCLFCKIVAGELPATKVAETDATLAFRDINPQAPTHILVIPKAHYVNAAEMVLADPDLTTRVMEEAVKIADSEELSQGYRLLFNTGKDSGQEVFHVHLHILGGKPLGPMVSV
ncbi:MAG TPA: histidine triad nucleotide-binding protein [Candidatus Stackebrandtia faecavium]|nr:histidine triad nucleotide-binding protein [Candidatus Stackebrandtia faecavium]